MNKNDERKVIDTNLSLNEHDKHVVSDVQKEMLQDEILELPPIKEGDINISAVYAFENEDGLEVKFFIRNGFNQMINFEDVPLSIINSNGDILARQIFDLKHIGVIPPLGGRPCKVVFNKENLHIDKPLGDDWKIVFDTSIQAVVYSEDITYENIPEETSEVDKAVLEDFLDELPKLQKGQISISTFNISMSKDGEITITLVIRNGADSDVSLSKIPVTLKTPDGNKVISGTFETNGLIIGANKAKLYNLTFKTNIIAEQELSLNECSVLYEA